MKINESGLDRIFRVLIGLLLVALYLFGAVGSVLGIVLIVIGAVLIVTGAIGFCPLYAVLKFQTTKK